MDRRPIVTTCRLAKSHEDYRKRLQIVDPCSRCGGKVRNLTLPIAVGATLRELQLRCGINLPHILI